MAKEPILYLIDPAESSRDETSRQLQEMKLTYREYFDADALLNGHEPHQPGCALAELQLGSMTAFQMVKRLRQRHSSLPVVLMTAHATVPLTVQAFRSGVFEVLEKPTESFQLWDCVTRAVESHKQEIERTSFRNGIRQRLSQLSRQEVEVMRLLFQGAPNKHIASRLGLSPRTIVFRRKSLMQKMQAMSVGELACLVQQASSDPHEPFTKDSSALLNFQVTSTLSDAIGGFGGINDNYS